MNRSLNIHANKAHQLCQGGYVFVLGLFDSKATWWIPDRPDKREGDEPKKKPKKIWIKGAEAGMI